MGIGFPVREDDDKQAARRAHAQGDESLLAHDIGVFASQGVIVRQNRCSFAETDPVVAEIGARLVGIPVNHYWRKCMDKCPSRQGYRPALRIPAKV